MEQILLTYGLPVAYSYADACWNIFNTIKTSGHSSLEKYTSHFIEWLVCERELETEQRLQHIDPHSSGYHSLSFPFSWVAQPGVWGPSLCRDIVLIPASSLQLIWTLAAWLPSQTGYIIVLHPLSSTRRQPRPSPDLLISSTGCTCYLHRCISSLDSLVGSEVNM